MKKTKKVLKDHKKIGKKFVPPLLQLPWGMKFVKWLDKVLPEIIWIGLLQEKFGIKRSIEICCAIANAARDVIDEKKSMSVALISNYKQLTSHQYTELLKILEPKKVLTELSCGLEGFIAIYPDCPLRNLVINNRGVNIFESVLEDYKRVLDKYFYRGVHLTNVMEGTALCMAILAGHVRYEHKATLPNLNALVTELPGSPSYEKTASLVRAATLSLVGDVNEEWSHYFWNRVLVIDECQK